MAAEHDHVLSPPDAVGAVPPERVAGLIPVDEEARGDAARRAEELAERLTGLDVHSPDFAAELESLLTVGEADMRVAAAVAGALLDRTTRAASSGAESTTSALLTADLATLRRTVGELTPTESVRPRRGLFGLFAAGRGARDLLERYRAANEPVNALVLALRERQDVLRRDTASIQGERLRLWAAMERLSASAVFAEAVDEAVARQASILDLVDPERATALRSDVLHPIRQRRQDILTQLAVFAQGYLALDLLRRTNDELIRGVDRAVTTTVAALRIALVVSAALANQREVLDEVASLTSVTDDLVRANGELLARHAGEVRRASDDPAVGVAAIRESFDRIHAAIDAVDGFRAAAVDAMASTAESLSTEIRRSERYLRRARDTERADEESR